MLMDLSPPLAPLLKNVRSKLVPKGQIIFYQGDRTLDVYVIKSGIVKLHDIDEQGNEKSLHLVKSPGIIPFAFFSGENIPVRWFYTALTDCELYVVPQKKLLSSMKANSELTLQLMNWFSQEVHELLTRLSSLGKTNARDKLLAALKFLVTSHSNEQRNGWWRVSFPVNHQLLADMVGITRESAAVTMKELQTERLIRNPRVTILEINRPKICD